MTFTVVSPDAGRYDPGLFAGEFARLEAGSRVVISMHDRVSLAAALVAAFERGVVAVPVDPNAPSHFVVEDSQAHAFMDDVRLQLLDTDAPFSPPEDRVMFYTSGTTGKPKGVVIPRAALLYNAYTTAQLHKFRPGRAHLTALPLYHCNALVMSLFGNYLAGGTLVLLNSFQPERFLRVAREYCVRQASVVPTMVADLVTADPVPPWPLDLEYLLTAAAPLSRTHARLFYERYGPRLVQGYGLSEAVNFSFTMPRLTGEDFVREMCDQHPPVGHPLPGTEFRLFGGEVQVRGPGLMRCYWRRPEETHAAFCYDGWLHTGDLGEVRGNYLVLTGRAKELIIRGGENLSPVAVEEEYRRAGVQGDFCVAAADDPRLGETVGLVSATLPDLSALEPLWRPSAVAVMPVPRTPTGKPRRRACGPMLTSQTIPGADYEHQRGLASWFSRQVLALGNREPGALEREQVRFIHQRAAMLTQADPRTPVLGVNALEDFVLAQATNLPRLWSGQRGAVDPGLWESLMCDPPMGLYAELVSRFLVRADLLRGTVVELGAGVGNLSRLITGKPERYVRTDARVVFLDGRWASEEVAYDFDEPALPGLIGVADTVVAVNALHCAAQPYRTLLEIRRMLKPGGVVVLGEGNAYPDGPEPWALDPLFGFYDGWWDRGGFRPRSNWLRDLDTAGFHERGYGVLRAGRYDLGGVVWGRR